MASRGVIPASTAHLGSFPFFPWLRIPPGILEPRSVPSAILTPGSDCHLICLHIVFIDHSQLGLGGGQKVIYQFHCPFNYRPSCYKLRPFLLHQSNRLLIQVGSMLNGVTACVQCRHDTELAMAVGRHYTLSPVSLFNQDFQLGIRELPIYRIIKFTRNTSNYANFDQSCTFSQLKSDGLHALVDSVTEAKVRAVVNSIQKIVETCLMCVAVNSSLADSTAG
jgi:hypothetical protein